jgi:hypothetical protein
MWAAKACRRDAAAFLSKLSPRDKAIVSATAAAMRKISIASALSCRGVLGLRCHGQVISLT